MISIGEIKNSCFHSCDELLGVAGHFLPTSPASLNAKVLAGLTLVVDIVPCNASCI